MSANYRKLGEIVELIDERNRDGKVQNLIGVSIDKCFIKSVANTIGTDLTKYQVIRKNDFACSLMQVSRDGKIPIACLKDYDEAIMSPAYYIFRIKNTNEVLPDYLAMWFMRSEFDREASYIAVGGVRGSMPWEDFCDMKLPVPDLKEQEKIVNTYSCLSKRIQIKQKINENLEKTAQCLFDEIAKNNYKSIKLKNLCTMQYGYTETASFEPIGKKFLRITDITNQFIDWKNVPYCQISDKDFDTYKLQTGDVVVARTGATVGVAKIIGKNHPESVFASFLVRIKAINNLYQNIIGLAMTSKQFLNYIQMNAGGSAQPQANPPLLGEYEVQIPENTELKDFNMKIEKIYSEISIQEQEIMKLQEIRKLIISRISMENVI